MHKCCIFFTAVRYARSKAWGIPQVPASINGPGKGLTSAKLFAPVATYCSSSMLSSHASPSNNRSKTTTEACEGHHIAVCFAAQPSVPSRRTLTSGEPGSTGSWTARRTAQ